MKDRLKALDKKTIAAIVATCILIIIAIIGAVAFLKDDGSTSASDEIAQRESENSKVVDNERKDDSKSQNETTPNENVSNENTNSTDVSNNTENTTVNGTSSETTANVNANVTRNGTTTATTNANVPNQEYVTERVEETERQITEDLMVSWQKLDLSGKFTNINIDESNVTAKKFSSQDKKTVVAGDLITYTIEVKNISKEAKKGIKVSDAVPVQTELVEIAEDADVKEIDGAKKIYWSIDFAEGEEAKLLSFTVRVLEDATGTIRNVAVVNGEKTNETHNTIINTIKTSEIVKCDREEFEGTTVHENDEIKYTLTIKNTGDIAEKISVSDAIKEGLTFKEGSLEVKNSDVPVKFENGEVSLEDYELAANTTLEISFVATVNPLGENADGSPVTLGKINANKVTVNSKETTDKTPDGGDKDYNVVKPYVETSKASKVVKCDDYGMIDGDGVDKIKTVHEGDEIEYTITVSNKKGTASDLVSLRDEIPEGLTFIADSLNAEALGAGVKVVNNVLTLDDYTIAAEAVLNITFRVRVNELGETKNEDGTITKNTHAKLEANKVIVNGDKENPKEDPNPPTDVKKPMISTTKVGEVIECTEYNQTGKVNVVHENDEIKYTITVSNSGDEKGKVNLTDTIKSGLSFVSVTDNKGVAEQVTDADGNVTGIKVENYELAAGDSLVITLVVKVDGLTENDLVKVEDNKYVYKKVIDANVVTVNDENIPEEGGDKEVQKPLIETTKTSVVSECTEPEGLKQTGNVSTVHEGDTISYTITVSNEKGSASKVINVEDEIPEGLTLDESSVRVSKTVDNMTVSGNKISISGYTLEAGEKLIITFNVTVNTLGENDYVEDKNGNKTCTKVIDANYVVVNGDKEHPIPDPDGSKDVKKAIIETSKVSKVVKCDDYSMIDGDGIDKVKTVHEGDEIEYTITVSNAKGSEAGIINLNDTIPEGLSISGNVRANLADAQAKIQVNGKTITLTGYKLQAGATLVITFNTVVDDLGTTTNDKGETVKVVSAKLTANKVTVNGIDKEDSNPPTEIKKPNIEISKTSTVADKDYVRVGESFDYIITAKNNGTEKGNAVITDNIPAEFTFDKTNIKVDDQDVGDSVVVSGNKVEWTVTDLAAESSKVLKIRVTVKDITGVKAETTNTAIIDNGNPPSSTEVNIGKPAIDVTKSSQVATCDAYGMTGSKIDVVHENDEIQYTITVENNGVVSDKINVRDELKDKVEFVEGSLIAKVGNQDVTDVKAENGVISLDNYELAAGSKLVITFKVRVKALGVDDNGNKITKATFEANTVNVNGKSTEDPKGPNEIKKPDLNVTKTSSIKAGQYAEIGKQFSYYIVVDNKGDEKGSAVVEDNVPSNLRIDSYGDVIAGDTISVEENKVTWNVTNLPARSSRIIEIKVTPISINGNEETITNKAEIKDGPESSTDVTIAKPIISTTKASRVVKCDDYAMVDGDGISKVKTVHAGDEIEYTITVTNSGKVAGNVSLEDALKTGVTYVASSVKAELVTVASDNSEVKTTLRNVAKYDTLTNKVSVTDYSLVAGGKLVVTFKVSVNELTGTKTDGTPITEADFVKNEVIVNGESIEDPDGPEKVKKPYITATKTTPAADVDYIRENESVVYTITVTNNGKEKGNAVVTDTLDSRLNYKTSELVNKYEKDNISYDSATRTVTWNVFDLEVNESRTATITVWVGSFNEVSETIPNKVLVDNEPTDEVEITVGKPMISTQKTSRITDCTKNPEILDGTTVHEGDEIEYTITISNDGTVSKIINAEDQIKDGLTYVENTLTASLENTGAVITNGKLVISNYELAGNAELTITFKVSVDELDESDYLVDKAGNKIYKKVIDRNAVVVDGKTTTDDKDYEVIKPMINTTKDVSKALVSVGEEFFYVLKVENKGTDSGSVIVTDEIPEGLTYKRYNIVIPMNCADVVSENDGELTWNVNSIAPNETREMRVYVTANELAKDGADRITITNTVKQDGEPTDHKDVDVARPVISTTKASKITNCTQMPKVLTGSTVHEGDEIEYTITIENKGDVTGNITVEDPIPSGMTYKTGSLNGVAGAFVENNVVKLNSYSLEAHEKLTITFKVTIDDLGKDSNGNNATSAELNANTVKVNNVPTTDPNPPTDVKKADIVIAKTSTVTESHVNVDGEFEYVITATNRGEEVGSAVVTDIIPSDFKYMGYTQIDGDVVNVNDPEIKWNINNLAAGASRELRIKVIAKDIDNVEKKVTNTATIDNGNPPSSTDVTIGKAKISTAKVSKVVKCDDYGMIDSEGVDKITTVHEGDEIEYTITISNDGTVAGIVNMNDTLPQRMTYKAGSLNSEAVTAGVSVAENVVSLNNYSLPAESKLTITFRVTIDNLGTTTVDGKEVPVESAKLTANKVTVNGVDREDPEPPTDVKKPIINTTKTSVISECTKGQTTGTTVHEGDKIKYTITVSNSGTEYKNIDVSDTLKSGISLIENTIAVKDNGNVTQGIAVSEDKRTISLNDYRLEAGHTVTIEFEVSVDTLSENVTKARIEANQVIVNTETTTDEKTYEIVKPNINVTKQVLNTEGNDINGKTVDVRSTLKYVLVGSNTGDEDSKVTITDDIDISKLTDVIVTGVIRSNETDTPIAVTYENGKVSWSGLLKKNGGNQVIITIEAKTRILNESELSYVVENTSKYIPEGSSEKTTNKVTNNVEIMIESDKTAEVINAEGDGKAEYGDIIEYTITAENKSDSDGKVNITDPLPKGVEYSETLEGKANPIIIKVNGILVGNGSYDAETRTISYNGNLAANAKLILTFKVKVTSTNIDEDIVNTATINGIEKSATVDVVKKISVSATAQVTKSMDLVLVLDVSRSMTENNIGRLDALKVAAKALVNKVFPDGVETDSTVTIIAYSKDAETSPTYTYKAKASAISRINNLRSIEGTDINDGLVAADNLLTGGTLTNDKKVVIFLSDGAPSTPQDYTGLIDKGSTNAREYPTYQNNSVENIIASATNVKAHADMVYSIGLGTEKGLTSQCAYVAKCSELSDVITSDSNVDTNNNKVTITLRNSSSREVTVTRLTANISGITGVTSDDVTYTEGGYYNSSTLTWNNSIVVPANGTVLLEVYVTRDSYSWGGPRVSNIIPEYQRVCTNATHQAMNSVVPFDGIKTARDGSKYHYYTETSLAKFVLKTIGKNKYIPVDDGADTTATTENLSKEFDTILKDSSTTHSNAITSTSPAVLTIPETANVIGDVVLSIGGTSYTYDVNELIGSTILPTGDVLKYVQGVGFTLEVKDPATFEKELHIAYTVDKK